MRQLRGKIFHFHTERDPSAAAHNKLIFINLVSASPAALEPNPVPPTTLSVLSSRHVFLAFMTMIKSHFLLTRQVIDLRLVIRTRHVAKWTRDLILFGFYTRRVADCKSSAINALMSSCYARETRREMRKAN